MLNGLDLFSGIGGMSIALQEWVRSIAYCEIDAYCQGVLLSRMVSGGLRKAPIWDDIKTLHLQSPDNSIDILYGGFPCQDISVAGRGKGLGGERSGLFFEIVRLAKEIKPSFIFLENVPAITTRGGIQVIESIAEMGYDCRWCVISAASIGALHRRERWFLLGYTKHNGSFAPEKQRSTEKSIHPCTERKDETCESTGTSTPSMLASESLAHPMCPRGWENLRTTYGNEEKNRPKDMQQSFSNGSDVANTRFQCERCLQEPREESGSSFHDPRCGRFWETEPNVGRVADGIPERTHRIKSLGNAVVPQQAKEAFKILMGMK